MTNAEKSKLIPVVLCVLTILWLVFIFALSSQNGTQTTKTSVGVAQKTAEIIYNQPTEQQVNKTHFNIRKLAHIGLFFILGILMLSSFATSLKLINVNTKFLSVIIAVTLTTVYGFFDEWQKQFIDGRHFQLDEAMLNIISGMAGVVVAIVMVFIFNMIKLKTKC